MSHATAPGALRALALAGLLAACLPAAAGVSYRLDRPSAAPGDTVRIEAVYFNDGNSLAQWQPPARLVLQWRDPQGQVVRTFARLEGDPSALSVPVNNFARLSWAAVVPVSARGLQAVSIEGEPALMALDATGRESGTLASQSADVPVTDPRSGQPLPEAAVLAAGASPQGGPAPDSVAREQIATQTSGFDSFRSAISAYEPMYFDIGWRGRTTARFQLSAKYRLFSPADGRDPRWFENFYLGYTQTSLWDLQGDSMPFIDTTFNPSLFWKSDRLWSSADAKWRAGVNTGVEHRSNGKDGDDSRSINDVYVEPALYYRLGGGSTLSFSPRVRAYFGVASENSDYADYAGHVDWKLRWEQDGGAVVSAMYRQGDSRRRTTQLDFSWPLKRTFLDMNGYLHLQYFNGYGETLLGYNQRNESQFRIGLSIVP
ncbi:phospholipase A [Bordetella hinzii]|uniref:Phospholipase A1 n=2 Tax=Bordetella hinzii TaxID=103855 RepID=A0ABR4R830_9BORD|nr:phospholipase A [Bordetella hinzii]AKQ54486.1 Putative phospholipase A1 precursor [Bordetella hinzii]KCB26579.1 phospholipase A1 [Bordetella hinzii OH87 BAL007II]KCB40990.1 phospholipase A1 [Bordetella hinzii 5132]KCB47857.1 phospholipase A1 [Bordetella hinzii 4161]KCB52668.1 phospholipase A1 [Bordetella hinzii 1277]